MEKKYLFVAGLLPLFMASCNNELEGIENGNIQVSNEIVGANLVSKGATLNVTRDGATPMSRIAGINEGSAGVWESNDKVALAWYNIAKNEEKAAAGSIYDTQVKAPWVDGQISTFDNKIYANHLFILNEGGEMGNEFTTQSNVYEGAHFVYYPFQPQTQIKDLTFEPNKASQKRAYNDDKFDESTLISAQDYINEGDVTDGTLNKKFSLVRISNLIRFNLQPDELFTTKDALKKIAIKSVKLQSSQSIFHTAVDVVPGALPTAVYNRDGSYNPDKTLEKMTTENLFGENKALKYKGNPVANISTTIDANATEDFTLSSKKAIRMFLLPVQEADLTSKLNVVVYTKWGYFNITKDTKNEVNKDDIDKLHARLYNSELQQSLTKLAPNNSTSVTYQLTKKNFTPTFNISNIEDWNEALDVAEALELEKVTFTLTNEVRFTDAMLSADYPVEITVQKSSETSKGVIIIAGDVTLPTKKLSFETTKTQVPVIVEANATLTIPEADAAAASADYEGYKGLSTSKVLNNGTIVVGKYATVEAVDNQNRIEVIYGSYVTLAEDGAAGVIAYNILNEEKETKAYQINNLIANRTTATQKRLAAVNTLVIANGVKFDLSMTDQGADANDDPYTPSAAGQNTKLNSLAGITIEMKGGKLSNIDLANQTVKGIIVLDGSNEIEDVTTTSRGNGLTVSGGEVTFTTAQEITEVNANKAFVTINGNMEVANNANAKAMTNVYVSGMINNNGTITANVGEGAIHANGTINTTNGTTKGVVIKSSATDF